MGEEIRLILIGKCGAGKSSLGNSLLHDKKFKGGKFSGTDKCEKADCFLTDGNKLVVIDTPGFSSSDRTDEQTACEVREGMRLATPGPHLFVLVMSLRGRYSLEDLQLLEYIYQIHPSLYTYHLIVVFTGFDALQSEGEEISITEYIHNSPPEFRNFIEGKIGNKFEVINNKDKKNPEKFTDNIMKLVRDTIASNQNTFVSCQSALSSTCSVKTFESSAVPSQNDFGFRNETGLNIVLLGKSGIGKSSLGNSLLEQKKFKTSMLENKGTTRCQHESKPLKGDCKLVIVDTPGFYRVTPEIPDTIEELLNFVAKIKPNVFILVLSINERFTGDELESMKYVEAVFGAEVFKYMIVIFTWLDFLYDDDDDPVDIEQNIPQSAKPILSKCGQRYACINNKERKIDEKRRQVQIILDMASTLVKENEYSCYIRRIQPNTYKRVHDLEADRKKRIKGDGGRAIRDAVHQECGRVSENEELSRNPLETACSWINKCSIL